MYPRRMNRALPEPDRRMPIVRRATLTENLAGISMGSGRHGEKIQVRQRGLVTSDDGPHIYQYLDSFARAFSQVFSGIPVETIATAVINITDGREVTAWINAEPSAMQGLTRQSVEAGGPVTNDDLAHIVEIELYGVDPEPSRGALIYVCRIGWRIGLYFDLSMLQRDPNSPIESFRGTLALVHNAIMLRDRVGFEDVTLRAMHARGWFPFIGLPIAFVVEIRNHVKSGWEIDPELEAKAVSAVSPRVPQMVETWKKKDAFTLAIRSLAEAARLFGEREYEAAYSMAWPRIEGVLRHMFLRSSTGAPDYARLRLAMVKEAAKRFRGKSALLPEQFSEYLDKYWLAPFDLGAGVVPTSRHSLAHGVAAGDELKDPVHCIRVFLTLEQIFHYAP